jgi:hypothetical protein
LKHLCHTILYLRAVRLVKSVDCFLSISALFKKARLILINEQTPPTAPNAAKQTGLLEECTMTSIEKMYLVMLLLAWAVFGITLGIQAYKQGSN